MLRELEAHGGALVQRNGDGVRAAPESWPKMDFMHLAELF